MLLSAHSSARVGSGLLRSQYAHGSDNVLKEAQLAQPRMKWRSAWMGEEGMAEEGRATLDGGGAMRIMEMDAWVDVTLFNLTLTGGSTNEARPRPSN